MIAGIVTVILRETVPIPQKSKAQKTQVKDVWLNGHDIPIHFKIYQKIKGAFRPLNVNITFRRFAMISAFMGFAMSLGWPLFPYVRERYATPSEQSFLWATFTLMQIISMVVGGRLADIFGRRKAMLFGRSVMFMIPIVMFFARDFWEIIWANVIGGLGFGVFLVASNAYIIDCAAEQSKGEYVGTYQLLMGISTFLGSLAMGLVAEQLFIILGQWNAIYLLLLVVAITRFLGGLSFIFVGEPEKVGTLH